MQNELTKNEAHHNLVSKKLKYLVIKASFLATVTYSTQNQLSYNT